MEEAWSSNRIGQNVGVIRPGMMLLAFAFVLYNCGLEAASLSSSSNESKSSMSASIIRRYDISDVTVSGVSSGGYMAVQMHVAHSSVISGCGAFAAGPFYCAESTVYNAEHKCMSVDAGLPQVDKLVAFTYSSAAILDIDSPTHLYNDRVYLFSGTEDSSVDPVVVDSLRSYYLNFVKLSNVVADFDVVAEHCFPTMNYGTNCVAGGSPYIGNCSFDGAGRTLTVLYDNLKAPVPAVPTNLIKFSQEPYYPLQRIELSSLSEYGYIYVPTACQTNEATCRLHISFHGCLQSLADIGNDYAANTGFNSWAEANNIIVLYPYAKPSTVYPTNPNR
jgi:hypothetical protein